MQMGLIGLGKMGGNMRDRLKAAGHDIVGYDRNPDISDAKDLADLVSRLDAPRAVWVMVPAGDPTRDTVKQLADLLDEGDLVIDGGNSKFTDDQANADLLKQQGVEFVDCGVSGGVWGKENGYGLMCGGDEKNVERLMPIFDALRPEGPREEGWVHAGEVGAGHYAKMVHNGIEYGLMHAYAEGWELLEAKDIVKDVEGCFRAWSRGTVVRSWLLDLMVKALEETPHLEGISEYSTDSGEGRWTLEEAINLAVPMPVLAAALFARFTSRQENSPQMQAVAALRGQFGGHEVMKFGQEPWRKAGQAEVSPAAEKKDTSGEATPGAKASDH